MENTNHNTQKSNSFWLFCFLLFLSFGNNLFAQTLTGNNNVNQGEEHTYQVNNLTGVEFVIWHTPGGTLKSSTNYQITVIWNSPGTHTLRYEYAIGAGFNNIYYDVVVNATAPSTPPNPTILSTSCSNGTAILQRTGNIPTDVTWYWQGKVANGTSTTKGSGSTFTANEGSGTYYIRARNNNGQWSSGSGSRSVTISTSPEKHDVTATKTTICSGETTSVFIDASQTNVNYQLYQGTNAIGDPKEGTTYGITWNKIGVGTYRVAATNADGSCGEINMNNTVTIGNSSTGNITASSNVAPFDICPGTPITLSASGGLTGNPNYIWKLGNATIGTGESVTVTPPTGQSTTYTVTGSVGCGNTDNDTVTITVDDALGTVSTITGGVSVRCIGDSTPTDYNAQATGAESYSWDIAPSTAGNITNTGIVSWNSSFHGDATITVTPSNSCSTGTPTSRIVSVSKEPISYELKASSLSVCTNGTTSIFIDSSENNVNYQLYQGNTAIYDPKEGDTYGIQWDDIGVGTYRVTATNVNGPCNSVDMDNTITIGSTTTGSIYASADVAPFDICPGNPITLSASGGKEGSDYTWKLGEATIGTGENITVTPPTGQSTTYTVTGTTNCNTVDSYDVVLDVGAEVGVPTVYSVPTCQGLSVVFSASGISGATYKWYTSSGDYITSGNSYITAPLNTTTNYKVSASINGCESALIDTQAVITPMPIWYEDSEGDGFGDPVTFIQQCTQPENYVANNNDLCPEIFSVLNDCIVHDPADQNYIYTRTYQTERNSATPFFVQDDNLIQNITYFDGIGRPMQQIAIAQSPAPEKHDIITHVGYDDFGRQTKEWLPLLEPNGELGKYRTQDLEIATQNYYNQTSTYGDDFPNLSGADVNAYSEKYFEPSPLNRVFKQAAPGEDWRLIKDPQGNVIPNAEDHAIEFNYTANIGNEVRFFKVKTNFTNNTYIPTLEFGKDPNNENIIVEFYTSGELYKSTNRDENHPGTDTKLHTTEEFKDKLGRVILKRTYALSSGAETSGAETGAVETHDTYYVYDDFGNLTYVLPPKMEATDADLVDIITNLPELGYQYIYDRRNRLVEKQIPGKGKESIVYNKLDQPVLTQDANQRAVNNTGLTTDEWLFTKYDALGRVAYTGKVADNQSREEIQTEIDAVTGNLWVEPTATDQNSEYVDNVTIFYPNHAYPTSTITEVLTINYYDTYDFNLEGGTNPGTVFTEAIDTRTKGLATGNKVKVLTTDDWIHTVNYYDEKGRPVYVYSKNEYLGTVDIAETLLDFVGKPLKTKTTHIKSPLSEDETTIVTIDNFTYDHVGRLLSQTQCVGDETLGDSCTEGEITDTSTNLPLSGPINSTYVHHKSITVTNATLSEGAYLYIDPNSNGSGNSQELIAFNKYDELGQLTSKKVGGSPANTYSNTQGLQTVDYKYNVRGWLKTINEGTTANGDLFGFAINYNSTTENLGASPLYNGNISETIWQTSNDNTKRAYGYNYDALNRITNATSSDAGKFNLGGVTYDKNGNIFKLQRQGAIVPEPTINTNTDFGTMDDLTYVYDSGNKLLKVTDAITGTPGAGGFKDGTNTDNDYTYDDNGNMTIDRNKGISNITYNHLNLPTSVTVGGNDNLGVISYIYDATGVKLKKTVTNGTTTEYAGNFIYENGKLQFMSHAEGTVSPNDVDDYSAGFDYTYNYTDHLGNIRLSYTNNNGTVEIVKESNYYPFGLQHKGYNNVVSSNANSVASKFKYTGKELQEELGLNMYDYGARMYDPALGRFMSVDKLADHLRQINRSPYAYGWNNPVYYNDPDGNCPQCISGAIVGAVLEILSQVGSSMLLDGLSFEESLDVLDYSDIAVETGIGALSGALDGGASKLAKFLVKKKNRKLLAKLLGVGIDLTVDVINASAKNIFNAEEDVLTTDDIIDILVSAGLGELADELLPKVSTKKVDKKIDKQTKKAKNSKSKKKRKKAKKKAKKAERAKAALDGVNSAASGTATSAASTGGKKVIDETKKEENE